MEKDYEIVISDLLTELGMPCSLLGYEHTKAAVKLCIKDKTLIYSVTKKLYPTVAKEFNTTVSRVERTIRHAVTVVFDRGDVNILYGYFGNTVDPNKGRPTNQEFIAKIVEIIKLNKNS